MSHFYFQVHRGIKGVVRDKDTEAGIPDAIIKVDDIDHHIRSGTILHQILVDRRSVIGKHKEISVFN